MGDLTTGAPTKVLFLLPGLDAGGAERVLINLMINLPQTQYQCVMASVKDGPLRQLIPFHIPFYSLNSRSVITALPKLYRLCMAEKPDVIISTMTHMNFVALMLKRIIPDLKVVVRESTLPSYFFDKYRRLGPLIGWAYRFFYKFADAIIAPSNVILEELKSRRGMRNYNYRLLYNAAPHVEPRPANASTKVRFLSVGRLHIHKGFNLVIDELGTRQPQRHWEWRIVGEGCERSKLQSLIERVGLTQKIKLEGFSNNPSDYYTEADALLLPSRYEGMPNVALEALAYGIPVISFRTAGGIGEIAALCKSGDVIIVDDVVGMVDAMNEIKSSQGRQSKLPGQFNKSSVMAEFEKILQSI